MENMPPSVKTKCNKKKKKNNNYKKKKIATEKTLDPIYPPKELTEKSKTKLPKSN